MRNLLALSLFALPLVAQSPFFVQGSDPQFGMYTADKSFEQETANFEFFAASTNRLKPAFVVLCGDLINQAGNRSQADEFFRIVKTINRDIPVYYVAGNHDVRNEPTDQSLAAYRERFGKDYYSFRQGSVYGIVLNSTLIHTPTKAQAEYDKQEQWLRTELPKAKASGARHIVIFQHHPWFLERAEEADQYFNIPLERRKKYLALFKQFGVEYLFSGHYHKNAYGTDGPLHMITTGPIGKPLGPEGSGFRIVSVLPDELKQEWISLGNIPNAWPRPSPAQ